MKEQLLKKYLLCPICIHFWMYTSVSLGKQVKKHNKENMYCSDRLCFFYGCKTEWCVYSSFDFVRHSMLLFLFFKIKFYLFYIEVVVCGKLTCLIRYRNKLRGIKRESPPRGFCYSLKLWIENEDFFFPQDIYSKTTEKQSVTVQGFPKLENITSLHPYAREGWVIPLLWENLCVFGGF